MSSPSPLKVLGLDPATSFGWSHTDGTFGVLDLSRNKDESPGMRLVRLWNFLEGMLADKGMDAIAFESSNSVRGSGVKLQSRIEGVIILFAERRGIPYRAFAPAELKKLATGSGNSDKDAMISRAKELRPKSKTMTHDMADAICVMQVFIEEVGKAPFTEIV